MATTFILPELGENIESGTVIAVLVKVGDSIDKDQSVIELETDKAVVEVPSPESGVISEIMVSEGETLRVGETILVIDANGAVPPPVPVKEEAPPKPAPGSETTHDAPAPEPAPPTETVEKAESPAPVVPAPLETAVPPRPRGTVRAAPSVRRFAREIGVDIHAVVPPTPGAPITVEDVKKHARGAQDATMSSTPAAPMGASTFAPLPLPNFERWGRVSREKMSTVRRVTAESMARSWSTIPHVTQNDKADITDLEKFRKQYGAIAQAAGGKLTVTAILVKILAEALKKFPQFNSSVDMEKHEIVYKRFYNIGVAVDTERGLLVPSIKNADQKSLVEIAAELATLSEKARTRKASIDDLQGSCMTITNLGGIGGTSFSPIVNAPEVAILGVSRGAIEPVYIDGEFVPRMMMPISLSYDHRVIDGADAARFARWVCQALEQPLLMHLEP